MKKPTLEDIKNIHAGRPAAILGGGAGLPEQIKTLPDNCLMIGVNHHAARKYEIDYVVFNDTPASCRWPDWESEIKAIAAIKYSVVPYQSDIDPSFGWDAGFSAGTATFLGLHLGCDPVILCGMDCYTRDRDYFYNAPGETPNRDLEGGQDRFNRFWPVESFVRAFGEVFKQCPHPERVRSTEPPLDYLFPLWDGANARAA